MPEASFPESIPPISYTLEELRAIVVILNTYLLFLKRQPDISHRVEMKRLLMAILARLEEQVARGKVALFLTSADIEVILTAMTGYINLIKLLFPANHTRDEVVGNVMYLHLHLLQTLQ